MELISIALIL